MMKALRSRGLSLIAQESFVERFDRFVAAVGIHWKPTLDDPLTLLKEFRSDQRTSAVTKRKLSAFVRTLSHCASRSRSVAGRGVRLLATAKT